MNGTGEPDDTSSGGDPIGPAQVRHRSRLLARNSTMLILAVAGIVFASAFAFAMTQFGPHAGRQSFRPTGIPADVSTSLADQLQLSPVPAKVAPGFTLTDQNGRPVSLSALRGRAVVLTFMDPHCTDLCPIISREFIDARRDLGPAAAKVVFLAVNVNPYYRQTASLAAYSREQGLSSVPSWHFLTGSLPSLHAVWNAYQIAVMARGRKADVVHTSLVYFIDPAGRERYVVAPMDDHTKNGVAYLPAGQLTSWARGIALVTRALVSPARH